MRRIIRLVFTAALLFLISVSTAHASSGTVIIKAMAKYLGTESGKAVSEQAVAKMTKELGEQLIERTAERVIREGGEKSLVQVSEMVAKHGPDVVRALDNAPNTLPILNLLDELPADDIGMAASRLAAGSTGKELASLSTKFGANVLRAEAKHPGVGQAFARALGSDGAELSLKMSSDQAIQIGRHVDDIAKLPAPQQSQLFGMISSSTDRFAAFVGRFVEKNPGKVLFTAAGTTLILSDPERFLGGDEVVFDADGNPTVVSKPGLIGRTGQAATEVVVKPIQSFLNLLGMVVVFFVSLFLGSKVWLHFQKDRLQAHKAQQNSISEKN